MKGKGRARTAPTSPVGRDSREHISPRKQHYHYKHREPAPKRLFKRLNSLFHPSHHKTHSLPSSLAPSSASLVRGLSSSSSRAPPRQLPSSPLVAEPESIAPSAQPSASASSPAPPPAPPSEATRPFLKIRICTFNMHDSLPEADGDLSDFLGDIAAFPQQFMKKPKKRMSSHSSFGEKSSSRGSVLTVPLNGEDEKLLPKFPLSDAHPYHIIVVCGQECPTASGILAGKVRALDGKGWTSMLENYLCGGCSHESDSESSSSSDESEGEREGSGETTGGESPTPAAPADEHRSLATSPNGDSTSVLTRQTTRQSVAASTAPSGSGHSHSRSHGHSRGPYVLVEKERLLGIYCAVFVARCCEDLVEGVSKGKVTAGLIGGRVGNKGGVGISLHFASQRLLFISAHLAAHASALEIRKANALKILEEMDVDDFWESSGKMGPKPRELSERFDNTFFIGDLNFRLNISRLHADWLIRAKDYASALRFDQLGEVLAEANSVFKGFSEGAITFGPTFKFDVPRQVKKKRSTILGRRSTKRARSNTKTSPIIDFSAAIADPDAADPGSVSDPEVSHSTQAPDDDSLSVISSVGTVSSMSVSGFDPAVERGGMDKADLSSLGLPAPPGKGNPTSVDAVRRAQVRFLTLVRSNSAAAAIAHAQESARKKEAREKGSQTVPSTPRLQSLFPPRPILQASQSAVVLPIPLDFAGTTAEGEETEGGAMEAVFDTSKKQRVQSYTDRVLFKSTVPVPPPSDSESSDDEPTAQHESRGFDFRRGRSTKFADAFRGLTHPSSSSEDEDAAAARKPRPSSADGPRRLRFGDAFSLPRFRSMSTESLTTPTDGEPIRATISQPSRRAFPRAKSLQPVSLARRDSDATGGSAETHAAPSLWKRVKSLKDLTSLPLAPTSTGSAPPSVVSPLQSPDLSTAATTPTTPTFPLTATATPGEPPFFQRRTPRKKFTLSSPPSSPEDSRPTSPVAYPAVARPLFSRPPSDALPSAIPSSPTSPADSPTEERDLSSAARTQTSHVTFPRSATISGAASHERREPSSSLNAEHVNPRSTQGHSHSASSASLNTRFKSFLNLLPLPFLSTSTRSLAADVARQLGKQPKKPVPRVGPRKGEVQVLKYDSVQDLAKMKATSDHRPVVAVLAIGLGEPEVRDEE
ncbi:hypothetical protein JCM10213v2_000056 [Rhodosporidiobolus nylandii]